MISGISLYFKNRKVIVHKKRKGRLLFKIEQLIADINDVDWDAYCDKYDLLYADDAGSENILYLDNAYATVETADVSYTVTIVGDNSFRF